MMNFELKKLTERNHIYNTASTCPFCGGTMLPLKYAADLYGPWMNGVYLFGDISGDLKACNQCGIVKFYPRDGRTDEV